MKYGYCRCSTQESKQDITRQQRELMEQGVTEDNIYWEYESGMKHDRIELNKLLAVISSGDELITTEPSRITRSTKQLCEIIELAKDKHIKLILGSFIVDCTNEVDPMTEGVLKLIGVIAELERNLTVSRVKSGLANAIAKGKKLGRPTTSTDDIPESFYRYYPQYKSGNINKSEFSRLCRLSYPSIYKYLKIVENK